MPKPTKDQYRQHLKIPKSVLLTAKILQFLSVKLTTKFASKLFQTPIRFRTPKREENMDEKAIKSTLLVPEIQQKIHTYRYGEGAKKILLVHGWSGRGTQLVKIADAMVYQGYSTLSFDAPAHGRSSGKTTNMMDFVHCILEMQRAYGPFEAAIGHSLGSMALLYSVKKELQLNSLILIGSGDKIEDIIYDFTDKLGLEGNIGKNIKQQFDTKFQVDINTFSASESAAHINTPVLLVHDKFDSDSPVEASVKINQMLTNSKLILTEGLGHRKILGDRAVLEQIIKFLRSDLKKL